MIAEYDEKFMKNTLNKSSDKEKTREGLNVVMDILNEPLKDITSICYGFKEAIKKVELDENTYNGVSESFVGSIIGNAKNIFNISDKRLKEIVDLTIEQNNNIKEQEI